MPQINLRPANGVVAVMVKNHFAVISDALQEASHKAIGFPTGDFVVELHVPPLAITDNVALLRIEPFASDRESIHGKEVTWRDYLALVWAGMPPEILEEIPLKEVDVWTHIAPGAKWGNAATVVEEFLAKK